MIANACERNIVLICDDAYVMPTTVTIRSIIDNSKLKINECLNVYVCTFGISPENSRLLLALSTANVKVRIKTVNKNNFKGRIEKIRQKTHVTPTSLIKFEIPCLLESEQTAVYLDSDIIVKGNICELFDIDLKDNYVAASAELWRLINMRWQGLSIKQKEVGHYFNSGVMLMNLQLMRDNNVSEKLWDAKLRLVNNNTSTTMDQDALNDVFKGKTIPLSIRWNLNTYFTSKVDIAFINTVYNEHFKDISDMLSSAVVLHYVGKEDKPWKYITAHCREIWDTYYVRCGYSLNTLERTPIKHGAQWKIAIIKNVLRAAGIKGVFRFFSEKIKE